MCSGKKFSTAEDVIIQANHHDELKIAALEFLKLTTNRTLNS